mmetsp:Transcript_25590/g.48794  ORF Transcript_25590/g.48794 Transcript_25590/m.48794 type:complete len:204 (+) Transcript_25590:1329-1940(+)
MTVTVRERVAMRVAGCPCNVASSQFSLTAFGSATPLNSTTIASNSRSPPLVNLSIEVNNSSLSEQHAHPFCSSTTPSAYASRKLFPSTSAPFVLESLMLEINLASMLTEATSLTIVPILMLELFSNKCLRAEVLPEPRKPASRMVGMGLRAESSSSSLDVVVDMELAPSTRVVDLRYVDLEVMSVVPEDSLPLLENAVAIMGD